MRPSTGLLLLLLPGCDPEPVKAPRRDPASTVTSGPQDIVHTRVELDLSTLVGKATVRIQPGEGASAVWLDVSGLSVSTVTLDGETVSPRVEAGQLRLPVPARSNEVTVVVRYQFPTRDVRQFDGWMPTQGVSFVWPDTCANLFPCDPDTRDGVTFEMEVTGADPSLTLLYPRTTVSDAPAYMPAIAVGPYVELPLGSTTAGTRLSAYYLPGDGAENAARLGTVDLVAAFDYFETTYGPYSFGDEVATVEVDWGSDSYGGMEHHPYFHVGSIDFRSQETQVHEAAHGWFGDGVRIMCWEDFVLSEGTVTYMTARALEQVGGPNLWPSYVADFLQPICAGSVGGAVMPSGCEIDDFKSDPLWSLAPYMKGACFYEEIGDLIGPDVLDRVIADFYQTHQGQAATMEEMIVAIEAASPSDQARVQALVDDWLKSDACPEDWANRCEIHQP